LHFKNYGTIITITLIITWLIVIRDELKEAIGVRKSN
jgi:hypothetical protein